MWVPVKNLLNTVIELNTKEKLLKESYLDTLDWAVIVFCRTMMFGITEIGPHGVIQSNDDDIDLLF